MGLSKGIVKNQAGSEDVGNQINGGVGEGVSPLLLPLACREHRPETGILDTFLSRKV
jgi:hypothetical protein